MPHDEDNEESGDHEDRMHHMGGPMRREFKLAMLDKKEKILKAKLEFIGKIRAMIEKMPKEKK